MHLSDDHRRVCMAETKTITGASPVSSPTTYLRFQLDNHLGTCAVEVTEDGSVISYEEYHPYGTSAYRAQSSSVDVSAKRYRYTGKERDEETGLYYHGARYYAPWLGRWTAADPLAFADGTGPYDYVRGSPIGLNDPSGRQTPMDTKHAEWQQVNHILSSGMERDPAELAELMTRQAELSKELVESNYFEEASPLHVDDGGPAQEKQSSSPPVRKDTRLTVVFELDPATLEPRFKSVTPGAGEPRFYLFRNGRNSPTSSETITQLADPQLAPPLTKFALEKLRADNQRFEGEFPTDYYVDFSQAILREAIRTGAGDPAAAIDQVERSFGREELENNKATLHAYEARARVDEDTGFDKVQHFMRSATEQYGRPSGLHVDALQYLKEVFMDEVPSWLPGSTDKGYDPEDMKANNLGQAFGRTLTEDPMQQLFLELQYTEGGPSAWTGAGLF